MPSQFVDRYGRVWTQQGESWSCGGTSFSGAHDPQATADAMAPEGYQPPQPNPLDTIDPALLEAIKAMLK